MVSSGENVVWKKLGDNEGSPEPFWKFSTRTILTSIKGFRQLHKNPIHYSIKRPYGCHYRPLRTLQQFNANLFSCYQTIPARSNEKYCSLSFSGWRFRYSVAQLKGRLGFPICSFFWLLFRNLVVLCWCTLLPSLRFP